MGQRSELNGMCIESLMSALASVARVPGECCHMHARAGSFSRSQVLPLAQLLGARIARYLQLPSELTTDGVPVTSPFEKATDRREPSAVEA